MKAIQFAVIIAMVGIPLIVLFNGCKYDVAEPMWERPYEQPPIPKITSVTPTQAGAGVNLITINGEQLASVIDTLVVYNPTLQKDSTFVYSGVYFNGVKVEIKNVSATSITVYRPNIVADSCIISVVPKNAIIPAQYTYGRITLVAERFGGFLEGARLGGVCVGNAETLFVCEGASPYRIWKVTPEGVQQQMTLSGITRRSVYDAKFRSSTNRLYLFGNNREIQQVDVATGVVSRYTQMPSGKPVRLGDFDQDGYLYTAGISTDLCIVPPSPPTTLSSVTTAGAYQTDEILAIRVYNGYVYVAARQSSTQLPAKIYRHQITGAGTIAARELVLDMGTTQFSSRVVRSLNFSASGLMFVVTESTNPILVYNSGTLEYFYKDIIPPSGRNSAWGNGNYLYMISGDETNETIANRWNIIKIDMGETGK